MTDSGREGTETANERDTSLVGSGSPLTEQLPWERQFGESKAAFLLFCAYRDLGPERSISKLEADGGVTVQRRQLERYSSDHRWVPRTDAWDIEQERIRRERAGERQAKIDEKLTTIAEHALKAVEERARDWAEHGLGKMSPTEVMKVMETVVKLQRLVARDATSISQENPRTIEQFIRDIQASGREPTWG